MAFESLIGGRSAGSSGEIHFPRYCIVRYWCPLLSIRKVPEPCFGPKFFFCCGLRDHPEFRVAGLDRIVSVFAQLEAPIPFDALDGEPVDLVFLLLAPEHAGAEHLKALARISRILRDGNAIEKLRASHDKEALYALLTQPLASEAA